MSERSKQIFKLQSDKQARWAYIKAKIGVLVPSQIRALRLKSDMMRQSELAAEAAMQQSRISKLERPGASNVTIETLAWLAAIFRVGLVVKFVPFSEMIRWENTFSQDEFDVIRLEEDVDFLHPVPQNAMVMNTIQRWEDNQSVLGRQQLSHGAADQITSATLPYQSTKSYSYGALSGRAL